MPKIIFTHSYEKKAVKFIKKHPELKNQYMKTLQLMEINPKHPSLRLHQLKGKLSDLHSISINISYRITIEFIIQEDTIIPISIGTHDEIY
ncbi:plasmid stabilization protein [Oceanispirochaeta crateris]|uniref:Plasmid stabilization protein n=1 Tax=Oceanispirochaeta crateris TaxID=2518645 RepID=A0A5C1QI33_9SPIO|nr:type II toxin-antitoxin system RelE/ParE family toxin [Oceanispirochaeta crateris]QEN06779.1 plasmid stabilization protein [Oceanispirochaeta crateris]